MDADLKTVELGVTSLEMDEKVVGISEQESKSVPEDVTLKQTDSTSEVAPPVAEQKVDVKELEKSIQNLHLKDGDKCQLDDLTKKLEMDRAVTADESRAARKAAWIEESRMERIKRQELRASKMEHVFPELVWKN